MKDAFAGESQANRKYLAFAKKAKEEGYASIAKLFITTAGAEIIHSMQHLQTLGEGVKSTADNLKAAAEGETFEFEEMYPPYIEETKKDGNDAAVRTFTFANEAKKVHAQLYKKALEGLEKNEVKDYYLCPVCGYIGENSAPEKCPICGTGKDKFRKY